MLPISKTIPKTNDDTPIRSAALLVDGADPEAAAVALVIDSARQVRQLARDQREAAQQQRIEHLRAAAHKLREMAGCRLMSGVLKCTVGLASAGLNVTAAAGQQQAGKLDQSAREIGAKSAALKRADAATRTTTAATAAPAAATTSAPAAPAAATSTSARSAVAAESRQAAAQIDRRTRFIPAAIEGLKAIGAMDAPEAARGYREVEKQQLQTRAEVAGKCAESARERESEAQRLENALKAQLEKLHDQRQRAARAAVGA